MGVRLRGIYATALTELLDAPVVQASPPIRERFPADALSTGPATVAVSSSRDRLGVAVTGAPDPHERVVETLTGVSRDTLAWSADVPVGAVCIGRVTETLGAGAVVDLGPTSGYLPYDAVEEHVETGDVLEVQVARSIAPWVDRRPRLRSELGVERPLGRLERNASGVQGPGEVPKLTDLLDPTVPEGWGLRWSAASEDVSMETLEAVLEDLSVSARSLESSLRGDPPEPPTLRHAGRETAWIRFGREGRFALDGARRAVTTTMAGHHRIKAGGGDASTAVDFVEALEVGGRVQDPGESSQADSEQPDLDFGALTTTFGPEAGDTVRIHHGKPDGRAIDLGEATVTAVDPEGSVTVERELQSGGTYDGLGTEREPGDVATTAIEEGRWWYPTVYRDPEGATKGTYVNVCTPVECFPDRIAYVDLHVDVVQRPDGTVERLDEDELRAATATGHVSDELAEKARSVAAAVEAGLDGG